MYILLHSIIRLNENHNFIIINKYIIITLHSLLFLIIF
jgi:hypothetical protein